MSKLARAVVAVLRGWGPSEQSAEHRASWPVWRLAVRPIAGLTIATMVITDWVTGADDKQHLSYFAYGGLYAIGVLILFTCAALTIGYWRRERGTRKVITRP
jgi:hypothetical protein